VKCKDSKIVNLFFGPPKDVCDDDSAMELFFAFEGLHVVCGGTTAQLASKFLGKPLKVDLRYIDKDILPLGHIEGVDVVTEGIVTLTHVVKNAEIGGKSEASLSSSSASNLIVHLLFDFASDINLFIGLAQNPHNLSCGIDPNYRIKLVKRLISCLEEKGKNVTVKYF